MAITTPGAVDYHLASQSGNLSIDAQTANVTLMCWLYGAVNSGGTKSMVGTYNTPTSGGTAIQIGFRNATGRLVVWTWGAGTLVDTQAAGGGLLITVPDNTWTHVAYTYDGTFHQLYVNGVLINIVNNSTGTSTITGVTGYAAQLPGTITAIFINGYPGGGVSETSTFSVDDISYFNRALSVEEILTAYSTAGDRDGIRYGSIASILFNEGIQGAIANNCLDYSGNGNTLTPIGAAVGVNFTYSLAIAAADTRPPQG